MNQTQDVRLHAEWARLQAGQFIFNLNPLTILTIDTAALVIGKAGATFRQDLFRRPDSLPKTVRRGGRVFVQVCDLIDFLKNGNGGTTPVTGKSRGRPTKAEQLARAAAAGGAK